MSKHFNYYELVAPQQFRAGYAGTEGTPGYQPFYYNCADCGAKEPIIKGFLGTGPGVFEIGVIDKGPGEFHLALFCASCFDRCMAENPDHGLCPVCGEEIKIVNRTENGWLLGSCGDAFTDEHFLGLIRMGTEPCPS